ncbi:MAG: hypothetical protein AB9842_08325 [Bacteroidales bacterium]
MLSFKLYVEKHLTVEEMKKLHEHLQCTLTKKTRILRKPEMMTISEIQKIHELLPELSIEEMIIQYRCGERTLTISEIRQLGLTVKQQL